MDQVKRSINALQVNTVQVDEKATVKAADIDSAKISAIELVNEQAAGSETATMTNAPAAGNPSTWLKVKVGEATLVVPAFPLA